MKLRRILALAIAAAVTFAVALLGMNLGPTHHARANVPNANLEYTLHVGSCSTAGDQKGNCAVTQGSTFVASVSLDMIPSPYDAIAVTLSFSGVSAKISPYSYRISGNWPDCALEGISPAGPNYLIAGCAIGVAQPASTFTGTVFTASFNCVADGQLSLVHGPADTLLIDHPGKTSTEAGPDILNIDCAPPTITPTPSVTPTPTRTPTPTPQPVGGISFDSSDGGDAGGGIGGVASALLISVSLVLLGGAGFAGWRTATRRGNV